MSELDSLILAHRLAVEDFREAFLRGGDGAAQDRAFEAEEIAMMALLNFPPETIEAARSRAVYLLATRFFDNLGAEGRVYLCSFIPSLRSGE